MKTSNIDFISILTDAIEAAGVDIAPSYKEYAKVAYAIASDCGEQGRPYFHRICQLYTGKRDPNERDRIYSTALANTHHEVHLGTVRYLAEQAGVDRDDLQRRLLEAGCLGNEVGQNPISIHPMDFRSVRPRVIQCTSSDQPAFGQVGAGQEQDDEGPRMAGANPAQMLPTLDSGYAWPGLLGQGVSLGRTSHEKDTLLLSLFVCAGVALGRSVSFVYSNRDYFPNLQFFLVAPPASGKGQMGMAWEVVSPLHKALREQTARDYERYEREREAWNKLTNERKQQCDPPRRPKERMFRITGNNTGTGILQNIIENNGEGLIYESEADSMTNSILADYGGFSDVLRKAFDHEGLAYNRRTDHEYRDCEHSNLSVMLSGTPGQLKPLIPSSENGLYSRQIFYYLPGVGDWRSQFPEDNMGNTRPEFKRLSGVYCAWRQAILSCGEFTLKLDKEQRDRFNAHMAGLLDYSKRMTDSEMDGYTCRLAINLLRIMCIVALLRATLDTVDWSGSAPARVPTLRYDPALITPDTDESYRERNQDGSRMPAYTLRIRPDDFEAVLALSEPLSAHALHVLQLLDKPFLSRRPGYERNTVFADLSEEFTTEQVYDKAAALGVPKTNYSHWINVWKSRGLIESNGTRGSYRKVRKS